MYPSNFFYNGEKAWYVEDDTLYINIPEWQLENKMIYLEEEVLIYAESERVTKVQVSYRGNIYQSTLAKIAKEGNNYVEYRTLPLHLWTKIVVETIPQDPTQRLNDSVEIIRRKHGDNSIRIGID